jgi:hypothetical protein
MERAATCNALSDGVSHEALIIEQERLSSCRCDIVRHGVHRSDLASVSAGGVNEVQDHVP